MSWISAGCSAERLTTASLLGSPAGLRIGTSRVPLVSINCVSVAVLTRSSLSPLLRISSMVQSLHFVEWANDRVLHPLQHSAIPSFTVSSRLALNGMASIDGMSGRSAPGAYSSSMACVVSSSSLPSPSYFSMVCVGILKPCLNGNGFHGAPCIALIKDRSRTSCSAIVLLEWAPTVPSHIPMACSVPIRKLHRNTPPCQPDSLLDLVCAILTVT